jgi:myo-inositol-1(or 4)-monophosphatase
LQLKRYLDFATETAYLAGRLTLGYFNAGVRPDFKADDSPVTAADRGAETLIRERITAQYPAHAIVGEEFGAEDAAGAELRWFIDPIDGTKAFIRGVPLYGVLLGLEIAGRIEVGVAYFPALDEMLAAASGCGCRWNGRPARVSAETRLERAYVSCTDPGGFYAFGRGAAWERLQRAVYHRAGWSDAYGYLLAATGRIEVMLDPIMSAWDCAPFPVILREAGGCFTDWQGNETIYAQEGLATTPALLPQVLATLT